MPSQNIIIFLVFYLLPFLIAVVLPAIAIPLLIMLTRADKEPCLILTYLIFSPSLIVFAFLTNYFWDGVLYNKIYYEWDRIILPFTFFSHEQPLLDGLGTWIAPGWTIYHLYLVWFLLILGIYIFSGSIALFFNRQKENLKEHRRFIGLSIVALTITSLFMSLVFPFIMAGLLTIIFHLRKLT